MLISSHPYSFIPFIIPTIYGITSGEISRFNTHTTIPGGLSIIARECVKMDLVMYINSSPYCKDDRIRTDAQLAIALLHTHSMLLSISTFGNILRTYQRIQVDITSTAGQPYIYIYKQSDWNSYSFIHILSWFCPHCMICILYSYFALLKWLIGKYMFLPVYRHFKAEMATYSECCKHHRRGK